MILNLDALEALAGDSKELTKAALVQKNILKKETELLKILGNGKIKSAVTIHADKASASALKAVEKAGGKIILPEVVEKEPTKRQIRKEERKKKD